MEEVLRITTVKVATVPLLKRQIILRYHFSAEVSFCEARKACGRALINSVIRVPYQL